MTATLRRAAGLSLIVALAVTTIAAEEPEAPGFVDEESGLFFAEQEAFFTAGPTGVGNLDYASGSAPSWAPGAPTGSTAFTVMNNYSTFTDFVIPSRYENTFTAEGTFVGHLDTIAIEFYWDGPATALCGLDSLAWDLRVDGETILYTEQAQPSAGLMQSFDSEMGQTRWVFTGIHDVMDARNIVADEATEHTVFMNFANFYACQEARALYGSAEAPARLIANLAPDGRNGRWRGYTEVPVRNPPPPLSQR